MDSAEVANAFELEMQKELDKTVAAVKERHTLHPKLSSEDAARTSDTDAVRGEVELSNDELFYDPNIDDENEAWVRSHRAKCHPEGKVSKLHSDAVLNCPACMTQLCLDCQRHSIYTNQYRAMFVTNCRVDFANVLTIQETRRYRQQKRRRKDVSESEPTEDDQFHPVCCTQCNTIVAMFDREEVFHFFNVLASYT